MLHACLLFLSPNIVVVWKRPVKFNYVPPQVFATLPIPNAAELAEMFDWFHQYGYGGEKLNGRGIIVLLLFV